MVVPVRANRNTAPRPPLPPPPPPMALPAIIRLDCEECDGRGWYVEYPSQWSRVQDRHGVGRACSECEGGKLTLYVGEWAGELVGFCPETGMAGAFASHADMMAGHYRQDWQPGRSDYWMLASIGVPLEIAAEVCR